MRVILSLLGSFLLAYCIAQQPVSYTINENPDQPSYEAYQLAQDSLGYMYIGCSAGLIKYDGYHYKSIPGKNQNGKAISHLLIDSRGTLWCQNFAGQIYYVHNDSLILFRDYSHESISFPQFTIQGSAVWILLKDRMIKAGIDVPEEFIPYPEKEEWNVISATTDLDDQLHITVFGKGLYSFNTDTRQFKLVSNDTYFKGRNLSATHKNKIIIASEQREPKRYAFHTISSRSRWSVVKSTSQLNAEVVYQWKVYEEGNWLCTSNGAFLYSDSSFSNVKFHLFKGTDVSSVFKDQEGVLWFTTLGGAIKVVPSLNVLTIDHSETNNLVTNTTACFTDTNGIQYIGTLSGKVFKLETNKSITELPSNKKEIYRRVSKILSYQNKLLIARGSLSVLENMQETIYPFSYIRDMALQDSVLFIINSTDFGKFNLNTRKYLKIKAGGFRKIAVDPLSKAVAISGNTGVQVYYKNVITDLLFENKPVHASAIQFSPGILWVATLQNGILGFENGVVKHRFQPPALRGLSIYSLYSTSNQLFTITESGIQAFTWTSKTQTFAGKRLSLDFQSANDLMVRNNHVYVATQRGYFYFPTEILQHKLPSPSIRITSATSKGLPFEASNSTTFSHDQNNIQIAFKAISFRGRNVIHYRYRLVGLSDGWITLNGGIDYAQFEALKPNNYQFEVLAIDGDGNTSTEPAVLKFTISPPFWQRWWFIMLLMSLSAGAVSIFFQHRIKTIKKKNEEKYLLIKSQLTALKAQMNPHFIHNALNSIQELIIKHDIENSNIYLVKFSMLMRKVLDASGKDMITITEEVEILELYLDLEKLRFGSDFSYRIDIANEVDMDNTFIPPLILQPFVENAIKHGLLHKKGEKKLSVTFEMKTNLVCTITDNGVGRKKSSEIKERSARSSASFSTQATERRIDLLSRVSNNKYSLHIIDLQEGSIPSGTHVELTISNAPHESK